MSNAQTVVIRDRVYCGGGFDDNDYLVFCYNRSQDAWNTLPACVVRYFGLGQVRGKLVTVGGVKKSDNKVKKSDNKITNEVFEFDEVTQSWKQSIPHMPTARHLPAVLSHRSTLTVAGGVGRRNYTSVVEGFREETCKWYPTEELPFPWARPSSLLINNRWYLLGGAATGEDISNLCTLILTYFSRRAFLVIKHLMTGTLPTAQHGRIFPTHHTMDQPQPVRYISHGSWGKHY